MQFSEKDCTTLKLIQRTPHVEVLVKQLKKHGYPSIDESCIGTRFQKCRRLYDILISECFFYDDLRIDNLGKVLHDSGNGMAGEILLSLRQTTSESALDTLSTYLDTELKKIEMSTSGLYFMKIFRVARAGNYSRLKVMMLGVAAKCAGMANSATRLNSDRVNVENYRSEMGKALLTKRDWMNKTILHVAVEGKSLGCVDIVLQYAQEARIKSEVLDAQDAFGQTALHLAIRRKNVNMTRKLIFEGSNVLMKNSAGEFSLQLIFQKFQAPIIFLMDMAVTFSASGDNADPMSVLNIDFGIICTSLDVGLCQEFELRSSSIKDVTLEIRTPGISHGNQSLLVKGHQTPEVEEFQMKNRRNEMSILNHVVSSGTNRICSETLAHPVAQTFLDLKWQRMKYLLLITYTGVRFLAYGFYMVFMHRTYFVHCPLHQKSKVEDEETNSSIVCELPAWEKGMLAIVFTFLATLLFHELYKAVEIRKLRFCRSEIAEDILPRFLLRLLFLGVVVVTCGPRFVTTNNMEDYHYQYSLASVGILISSGFILQVIGNSNFDFCIHSIYIYVYWKVFLRFLSVIITFSPLIAAFTLALNIMYPQFQQFSTFWRSLFRLIIMMQGEFDFEDKLYANSTYSVNPSDDFLFWSEQCMFGVLSCVLTLVLIDVFLGYTISDINELRKQMEFVRRRNQVKQLYETEQLINLVIKFYGWVCRKPKAVLDYFSLVPDKRSAIYRNDVIISFEEISEIRRSEFRKILVESN